MYPQTLLAGWSFLFMIYADHGAIAVIASTTYMIIDHLSQHQCLCWNDIIFGASLSEPHIDDFAVEFVCIQYMHISIVHHAVSHIRLLFCMFLCLFTNYSQTTQWEDSLMVTARTETICGPTSSMARAIGASHSSFRSKCLCQLRFPNVIINS